MAIKNKERLSLENFSKMQLSKDANKEKETQEINVKRLGISLKIQEVDPYIKHEASQIAGDQKDMDKIDDSNIHFIKQGVIEPKIKSDEFVKELKYNSSEDLIMDLFTLDERNEIAIAIVKLGNKEETIERVNLVKGLPRG